MEYSPYISDPKQSWRQGVERMTSIPYTFYRDNREKPWDYRRVCQYIDDPSQFIKDHYAEYKKSEERIDVLKKEVGKSISKLEYSDRLWDAMEENEETRRLHFDYLSENRFVTPELRDKYPEFSKHLFRVVRKGVIMVPPYATRVQVENYILEHMNYSICYVSSVNEREWEFIYQSDTGGDTTADEILEEYEVEEDCLRFHSPIFHEDGSISLYTNLENGVKVLDKTTEETPYTMLYTYLMLYSSHFVGMSKKYP